MDEADNSNLKTEIIRENGDTNASSAENDSDNAEGTDEVQPRTAITQDVTDTDQKAGMKRKKRKMEIELDYKLDNEYYYKSRERRQVVKYEDKPPSREEILKKKTEIKSRKKKQIQDRKNKVKYEDDEEQFVCETCHLPFMTLAALIGHRKKHLKVIKFKCALCSETFNTNTELLKHKIVHKDEDNNFLCMKCKTAFTDHLEYLKHKVTHQHLQAYKCIECSKEYTSKTGFYIHIETHFDKTVECDICHRNFKAHSLKAHKNTHGTGGTECFECGKVFPSKHGLDYHMISHTGVKPYQCFYCGKGFSNASQRIIHTRTHTNERPFECKVCHQKFKQSGDIKKHLVTHEKEKTITCDVCDKKFIRKDSLKAHMDIHNNTQKFKCNLCGKRVHTLTSLRSHLIYHHSDEKRFKCVPCEVSFKTKNCLNKHLRQKKHLNNQYGYNKRRKIEE